MKSTKKTRTESIKRIKSFMGDNLLSPEEQKSLQDVLDVLEDAEEYADLWNKIDNHIGINRVASIITMKVLFGEEMNLGHASHLCKILSSASYNVSGRNL